MTDQPTPSRTLFTRRFGLVAGGLLLTGLIAWGVVTAAILVAYQDEDAPTGPDRAPTRVADRPTLAAATLTPAPTLTLTPTRTPTVTHPATVTPTQAPATSNPSPTASAAPPTALPTTPPTALAVPALSVTPSPRPIRTLPPGEAVASPPAGDTIPAPEAEAGSEPGAAPAAEAAPGDCTPPPGWERYVVQPDDTLFAFVLGAEETVTVEELMAANCLSSRYLSVNQVLFLPPGAAENAPPSVPYVPPAAVASGPREANCPCTITVRAGYRREEIAALVDASATTFTGADFLAVTGPGVSAPFDFLAERPAGASLEGFLYPGTYTVQNETTAEEFRDMLLAAFGANVTPQMRADAAAQGVTFYQALILASIVQRESRVLSEQPLVASVYHNRLRAGLRLGTTVSVQYALGGPGNWWPRVLISQLQVESPYNTYNRTGLPPAPIDSPGIGAIRAAIYPTSTNYFYHTASCVDERELFAETYEEHERNVNCE